MQLLAPQNKIVVQIEKKYQDKKVSKEGWKYYQDTSYVPEWHVTCVGTVIAIPKSFKNPIDEDTGHEIPGNIHNLIVPEVQVKDELAFSYLVVKDTSVVNDSDKFIEVTEPGDTNKIFENGKKERVKYQHFKRNLAAAVWHKKDGEFIAGISGKPAEVLKWMKQFRYASNEDIVYLNQRWIDEQDYWYVDYPEAFAAKRKNEIIMLGGNVLLEKQEVREVMEIGRDSLIYTRKKIDEGIAKVISIGTPLKGNPVLGIKPGDMARFDQKVAQKYELWGENYLIVHQTQILGIEV